MDRRGGSSGVRGGDHASQDHDAHGTEKQFDCSSDNSGLEQQDARPHVAHEGSSVGSSMKEKELSEIRSMEELSHAIKLNNLSQVRVIHLNSQKMRIGLLTVAGALASGQMSALEDLWLKCTGLEDDSSEAIGNALSTSGALPSLTSVEFSQNKVGTKGIEALGRAIRSGNLKKLKFVHLTKTGINDDDMAELAAAFQHGEASVLPNLKFLDFSDNLFTEVGLQSLAEALRSGRLNSLERLWVDGSPNPPQEGAKALVSAMALNNCLVVDVKFEWFLFPDLDRRQEQLVRRNDRLKAILSGLRGSSMVPAAFGKIYLCGDPEVGKTTLSRTLQRTFLRSLWIWERRPHVETRTRGIDVSKISTKDTKTAEGNPITLLVWDMAGQQDYHLVHNAFFPALSFSDGQSTISQGNATMFVILCNSKNPDKVEQQLDYWLRYIASSYHETTKQIRHVFVVLNNIGGDKKVQKSCQDWEILLKDKRDKFRVVLDVHTDPFVVDVRRRKKVKDLKTCLLEHSRKLLEDQMVPEICDVIQRSLPIWIEARKEFPVLHWEEFVEEVEKFRLDWPEEFILSATKYLDEAGVLIYIDKTFPAQWGIPNRRLIILNPNWFCKEIIGNIFLSDDMVNNKEGKHLFRKKVDSTTGSISMSDFKRFFKSSWSPKDCEDVIASLLWLGLCYKDKDKNVFIPSLIDTVVEPGDPWQSQSAYEDGDEQWVMGFSIEHQKNEVTLAPMSLWHRFQVELAQTPEFNGNVPDNDFVAGRYFMTFTVDYMNVRIEVNAEKGSPTFDEISIFVKPKFIKDEMGIIQRKQCQVNLADDLVNILLGLWNEICAGVQYVHKVVWPWTISESWPWPVSQSRPVYKPDRNVEVAEVKRWVQLHGMGRKMQWPVGRNSAITEDQLLSTKDKENVIRSAKNDINVLRQGMQEAVNLRIYPPELTEESEVLLDGKKMEEAELGSDGVERATPPTSPTAKKMHRLPTVNKKLDKILNNQDKILGKVENIERILREGFAAVLNEQKRVFRKLQDTERFFKEDKDRTCPNLIYLGERDSGVWATLKQALSPTVNVRLRFACEAMFNNYRPHGVKDQQGLDVSTLKSSLKKIAPWLKVSLTVLLIAAKIGFNVVAPGAGLILPNFEQVQQAMSLLDGITWATGLSMDELDKLMGEDTKGLDPSGPLLNPEDIYGESREAISNMIGKLTPTAYKEKFGLRKVCLAYNDDSLHGIVWICTDCHHMFKKSNLVNCDM